MTEERKYDIALIFMGELLATFKLTAYSDQVDRMAKADAPFIVDPDPHSLRHHTELALNGVMNWVLGGKATLENTHDHRKRIAYSWLKYRTATARIQISNSLRRKVGNIAKRHGIPEIQAIEFYRLLLIDIVNTEFAQRNEEIPITEAKVYPQGT